MTTSEKTLAYTIGARVRCINGQCGKLAKIVIDPDTLKVSGVIVEEGLLLKRARVFPVGAVDYTDDDEIHLLLRDDELEIFPFYEETEFERPVENWSGYAHYEVGDVLIPTYAVAQDIKLSMVKEKIHQGVATGLEVVEKGTVVKNAEGDVGKLDHLGTDGASGAITHLIVRQGTIFTEQFKIPVDWVQEVSEEAIFVTAANDELAQIHQPETEPEGDQNMKNRNDESILTSETEVTTSILESLMADSRTGDAVIEVINERGVITLSGQVDSQETRVAAESIASSHPNVISVINTLMIVS